MPDNTLNLIFKLQYLTVIKINLVIIQLSHKGCSSPCNLSKYDIFPYMYWPFTLPRMNGFFYLYGAIT